MAWRVAILAQGQLFLPPSSTLLGVCYGNSLPNTPLRSMACCVRLRRVAQSLGIEVLGQFGNYLYVGTEAGKIGWITGFSESLQVEQD